MLTREELIEKVKIAKELENLIPRCELNRRIYQDVLDNYEQGEKYVQEQISYLKSVAGIILPIENAKVCINIYEYVLNGSQHVK